MTDAVILSAGQGRRLSPFTDNRPKCLVPVNDIPILGWQLRALVEADVDQVTVVTGFGAEAVEAFVNICNLPISVQCLFNPFYAVSDNIGTLWVARDFLTDDSLLINGDTLFDARIVRKVLDEATAPVSVTVDHKVQYDSDDMKVRIEDRHLTAIGKTLIDPVDGESIGMLRFTGDGPNILRQELDATIKSSDGLKLWYLSIIDRLAQRKQVEAVSIEGLPWAEIDFPADLINASDIVERFQWNHSSNGKQTIAARAEG